MNKKLLISLSSLSAIAVVAPILVIVSCSSEAPVEGKDLIIIKRTSPKITQADVTALKGTALPSQLIALNKLFGGSGLSLTNQANFKVAINETDQIVTLTANTGFTISGKSSIVSNKYTIEGTTETTNLVITPIVTPKLTDADVTLLGDTTDTDNAKKWNSLAKLFDGSGFKPENKGNFSVAINTTTMKVTLKANTGFTINNVETVESNVYTIESTTPSVSLNITANATVELDGNQILNLTSATPADQVTALKLLFGGTDLTEANLVKFTVAIDQTTNKVTLTAATGFTIGGQSKLDSVPYTVKNILVDMAPKNPLRIPEDQLAGIIAKIKANNTDDVWAQIGWFFHPTTVTNFQYFTFVLDEAARTITLTAKQGFIFPNNQTVIVSTPYPVITP
ncbi:MAG: hypothetical protein ACRDAW_01960 [Metamycoplasmataceae bacterium]